MKKKQYLLDTNICISLIQNKYGIRERVKAIGLENCFVSEVSIAELFYGASKSKRKNEHIKDVLLIIRLFRILPIYQSLELYGDMKAALEAKGMPIDDFDLLIGASAIDSNLIMVTGNVKHFVRLPEIELENWME